jgi:glycosyltransferase involved in cell wall biosynthesis
MRILMIAPEAYFQPKGTPFSVYNRALVISGLGHKVDLLTYPFGDEREIKGVRTIRCARFPFMKDVRSGPSSGKVLLDIMLCMKSFGLIMGGKYDIVYSHEEAGLFGGLFGRLFRKKTVYDMHSYIPELFSQWGVSDSRIFEIFGKIVLRSILAFSDCVVTNCVNLTDKVREIDPGKHIFTVENSSAMKGLPASKKDCDSLRKELFLKKEKLVVYTGSFVRLQNLGLLIESIPFVLKERKDVRFILVGAKSDEEHARYAEMAERLGIARYVIIRKRVPPEKIPAYAGIADVLVSPRDKGLNVPFKIYSLLESGKPIVASRSLLYNSFLDDTNSVLTEPKPESFAEGILEVLDDAALAGRLAAKALEKSGKEYSPGSYRRKMKAVCAYLEPRR